MPWRGLDRGAGQYDGSLVRTWNSRQWKRQRWISIPSNQKERIENAKQFHIVSPMDKRVVEGKVTGEARMMTLNATNDNQKWIYVRSEDDVGFQVINVGTLLPLTFESSDRWIFDEEM